MDNRTIFEAFCRSVRDLQSADSWVSFELATTRAEDDENARIDGIVHEVLGQTYQELVDLLTEDELREWIDMRAPSQVDLDERESVPQPFLQYQRTVGTLSSAAAWPAMDALLNERRKGRQEAAVSGLRCLNRLARYAKERSKLEEAAQRVAS